MKKEYIKNIFIIPARIGSKRIKKKNIKLFINKPIINYPIKILQKNKQLNNIFVSTESNIIKKCIQSMKVKIIHRPKYLSTDKSSTINVIQHCIKQLKNKYKLKNIICVYPCNPFLKTNDINKCIKLSEKNNCFSYPILKYSHPIQRALTIKKNGRIKLKNKNSSKRTQIFKNFYHDAGQFYCANYKIWLKSKDILSNSIGYEIPKWRAVDIDNKDDWRQAENLYKILK